MVRAWQSQDREEARQQWLQDLAIQTREQQEKKQLEAAQRKGSMASYSGVSESSGTGKLVADSNAFPKSQLRYLQNLGVGIGNGPGTRRLSQCPAVETGDFFWGSRQLGGGGAPIRDRHGHSRSDDDGDDRQQAAPIAISAEPAVGPPTISRTNSNFVAPSRSGSLHARAKTVFGGDNPDDERRRAAALEWQAILKEQIAEKKQRDKAEKAKLFEEERKQMETAANSFTREGGGDPPLPKNTASSSLSVNFPLEDPKQSLKSTVPQRIQRSLKNHPSHESGCPSGLVRSASTASKIPRFRRPSAAQPPAPQPPPPPSRLMPPTRRPSQAITQPPMPPKRLPALTHPARPPPTSPPTNPAPQRRRGTGSAATANSSSSGSAPRNPKARPDNVPDNSRRNDHSHVSRTQLRSESPPLPAQQKRQTHITPHPPPEPASRHNQQQHHRVHRRKEPGGSRAQPAPAERKPLGEAIKHDPSWRSSSPPLKSAGVYVLPPEHDQIDSPFAQPFERQTVKAREATQSFQRRSDATQTRGRDSQFSSSASAALDQLRSFSCLLMEEQRQLVADMHAVPA
ncbi:hypothetical protein BDZ88DRAFT_485870, partial [Geranomyces variabilis]